MNQHRNSNSQIQADDQKYLWHPFTQMKDYQTENPVIIESAQDNYLIDIQGRRYLDGVSSLWTNVHGHRQEKIDNAVKAQLDKVAHSTLLGLSNVPAVECAKMLIDIAPKGLTRVFYSDSGSTAVEIALKIAFQYHQQASNGDPAKKRFITVENAYHGDTIGSVSLGGIDLFHQMYNPLLFDTFKVPSPHCYRCPMEPKDKDGHSKQTLTFPSCGLECLNPAEDMIKAHHHEMCAMIVEPLVQGAAGILVHPKGYLKGIRELCTRYDIFMIADEVAVGFGKTGKLFACEHEDVLPDLMALAKGISGGYLPLAATLATDQIYDGFLGKYEEFKTFFHGHTYTGNPLACAAAIASMDLFSEDKVMENLQPKIARLTEQLQGLKTLAHVGDIRQRGIMVGIELVMEQDTKQPYAPELKIPHKVILRARENGVIIRPLGNVIVLMPPLSIRLDQIEDLCAVTREAIEFVTQKI